MVNSDGTWAIFVVGSTYIVVAGVPTYIVPSDIPGEFANWSLVLGRIKSESD